MTKTEMYAKIKAAKDGGRTLAKVLTEKGQFEHLQATFEKTLCGKDIDPERYDRDFKDVEDVSFWLCETCRKASSKAW